MDELAARWSDVLDQLDPEDKKVVLFELEGKTRAQQEAMLDEVRACACGAARYARGARVHALSCASGCVARAARRIAGIRAHQRG